MCRHVYPAGVRRPAPVARTILIRKDLIAMIFEKTGSGASYEEAVENAKALLAAPDEAELHFETV